MTAPTIDVRVPYTPRPLQREVGHLCRTKRFGVLVCHRRFGKTVLGVNINQQTATMCERERPRVAYIGPTYTQGKAVAWDYMQYYSRPIPNIKSNQSELRVDYPNGGQARIFGADNPDSLRGIYLDRAVLDEFGLHPSKTFSEVVGPTLVDRGGSALFLGTPNGKNQFYDIAEHAKAEQAKGNPDWFYAEYKASQTGLLDPAYLASARAVMTDDEYEQEFECSFTAAVKGSIYGKEIAAAVNTGRVLRVPYDPALPVDTDWDLGMGDAMVVWFSQSTRSGEVRLIDYHETSGEGFPQLVQVLRSKGYVYGTHWAPHDIVVRDLSAGGKTRQEVAQSFGIRFEATPRIHQGSGQEVEEGIHAVRMLLPRCYFDKEKTKVGLEALQNYRRDYNERLNEFKATPVHDWSSHAADAFRGLAVRHQVPKIQREINRSAYTSRSDVGAFQGI
jgi:phage terminase large subunit